MRNQLPVALMLLFALGFSVQRGNETSTGNSPAATADAAAKKSEKLKAQALTEKAIRQEMEDVRKRFFYPRQTDSPLRCLIATVPNPEIGYCAFRFDTIVESILLAADTKGYQLREFWLPWQRAGDDKGSGDKKPDDGDRKKALADKYGMLFFEGNQANDRLAVLLVSETPALGLNYRAFERALDFAHVTGPQEIKVLGPTFSGTAKQIGIVIQEKQNQKDWKAVRFAVTSGTATNVKQDVFQGVQNLEYHSFSENLKTMERSFLEYLSDLGINREQVALLSETGTRFGSQSRRDGEDRLLHLLFPSAIARLRNAHDSDPVLNVRAAPDGAPARKQLELTFHDSETRDTDRIPAFSPDLTAVSQEMVMQNISETIRRERIQAVGISATDVLDALFLAQMLQAECPNTRVLYSGQ